MKADSETSELRRARCRRASAPDVQTLEQLGGFREGLQLRGEAAEDGSARQLLLPRPSSGFGLRRPPTCLSAPWSEFSANAALLCGLSDVVHNWPAGPCC